MNLGTTRSTCMFVCTMRSGTETVSDSVSFPIPQGSLREAGYQDASL